MSQQLPSQRPFNFQLFQLFTLAVAMATGSGIPRLRPEAYTCSWRVLGCTTVGVGANASCLLTDAEFCTCCLSKALKQSTRAAGPGGPCPADCNEATVYGQWCQWGAWTECAVQVPAARRQRACACPTPFLRPDELADDRAGCQPDSAGGPGAEEASPCSAVFNPEVGRMLAIFLGGACLVGGPVGCFLCYIRRRLRSGGGGGGACDPLPLNQPQPPQPPQPPRHQPGLPLASGSPTKQQERRLRLESYDRSPLHSGSVEQLDCQA